MQIQERVRETHRPDWIAVLFGVVVNFAIMGAISSVGLAMGALQFKPENSVPIIVLKCLWIIGSIVTSAFIGGFITGLTLPDRSRVAAAMDAMLVWEFTVITFAIAGWFGYPPLPGIVFDRHSAYQASQGIVWMMLLVGVPIPFVAMFGAMAGNDRVRYENEDEAEIDDLVDRENERLKKAA